MDWIVAALGNESNWEGLSPGTLSESTEDVFLASGRKVAPGTQPSRYLLPCWLPLRGQGSCRQGLFRTGTQEEA